jgi:hypothetical protein
MAPITHFVKSIKELVGNLPAYKWYGECSCGFQTRMPTEQNVHSQLAAHLATHGVTTKFTSDGKLLYDEAKPAIKETGWSPSFKKVGQKESTTSTTSTSSTASKK